MTLSISGLDTHNVAMACRFDARDGSLQGLDNLGFAVLSDAGNWRLLLEKGCEIGPGDMAGFRCLRHSNDEIAFEWSCAPGVCNGASVTVTWQVCDGLLQGQLSYAGFSEDARVESIAFPRVMLDAQDSDALLIPQDLGLLVPNAPRFFHARGDGRASWNYLAGWTMQCSALLRNGRGMYFDTRDPFGNIKAYEFDFHRPGTVVYSARYQVPLDAASVLRHTIPYRVSLGGFDGGWHEVAVRYRTWARAQAWAQASAARSQSGRRTQIDDIALWCWNRGAASEAAVPVEMIGKRLGLPVALDWYWWHRHPYDTGYPCYLPPREGDSDFRETVERLTRQGVFVQVYTNGLLWDMDDASWPEGGQESATVTREGSVKNSRFNAFLPHRLAYMCGAGKSFQRKMVETATQLKAAGLSGLYLDMVASCCNQPCYNPSHDHAPGGGNYQVEGFGSMLREIAARCGDFPLSSENCCECFMDILDAVIMLDPSWERVGWRSVYPEYETVPLFRAVYDDAFRLFGNYALIDGIPPYDPLWPEEGRRRHERDWRRLCPDQFFVEIARTVIWGLQPTVANLRREHLEDAAFAQEIAFLEKAAKFHRAQRCFLLWGEMLAPGTLETELVEMSFVKRMIFTREGEEDVFVKRVPAVLHSVWRDHDGRSALLVVNCSSTPQPCLWRGQGRSLRLMIAPRDFKAVPLDG